MLLLDGSFLRQFEEPEWEPFPAAQSEHLAELNRRVAASGTPLEGNLFYKHRSADLGDAPNPARRHKRRNFALYAASGSRMLEIGFNAGHSALLALSINPQLRYTGIDLGRHPYTRPCADYLREVFSPRFDILYSDSRKGLTDLSRSHPEHFDLFHVDGGHGIELARSDLLDVIGMARPGQIILIDDTNAFHIAALADAFCLTGRAERVSLSRLWSGSEQTLLRRL